MTAIAAILLCCTGGDRDVAAAVHAAAVHAGVDPAIALAVACVESGLSATSQNPMGVLACYPRVSDRPSVIEAGLSAKRRNPMGARSCYGSVTHRPPIAECIAIGVRSLANRLRGCGGDERCAARRYNGSAGKMAYAVKVMRIARFVRGRVR